MRMLTAEENVNRRWLVLIKTPAQNGCSWSFPNITFINWTNISLRDKISFVFIFYDENCNWKGILVQFFLCCSSRKGWWMSLVCERWRGQWPRWSVISPWSHHVCKKIINAFFFSSFWSFVWNWYILNFPNTLKQK